MEMMGRGSGILLHVTSLPSLYGIGDLGPAAYEFADVLAEAGQKFWQILPVGPTDPARGNSPYSSASAFAGNPLLVSPDLLAKDALVTRGDLELLGASAPKVEFDVVIRQRAALLAAAYRRFRGSRSQEYQSFLAGNAFWLDEFAAFVAAKTHFGGAAWSEWPLEIRLRKAPALASLSKHLADRIDFEKFVQFLFFGQWQALKGYCNSRNVEIMGDIPIYVSDDSADAWSHPEIFKLDGNRRPTVVAGVPPDYFSKTGQLWGNPLYRWDVLKETGYAWWLDRIAHALKLFDVLRVDHFRGFSGYWEVPAGEKTAVAGRWASAPAADFFEKMTQRFPSLPIIAEDLGIITPDVKEIMRRFEFPGMKVLLFAFGDKNSLNPYLPHNYDENCVVYTGTHDNNTARGWFEHEAAPGEKQRLLEYLGCPVSARDLHWELIRLAMMSVARTAIFPMQDVLGLGQESRMNVPSVASGNWTWRLMPGQASSQVLRKLLDMTEVYGRGQLPRQ
jgi:4-alpha-glucanotransferase